MAKRKSGNTKITQFEFEPGTVLAGKYEVIDKLGAGWEGEVYKLRERGTGIDRAGKFFFPHRNQGNRSLQFYAQKLHKLRHCPILIQYHTREEIPYQGQNVRFLVSEYVEGEILSEFLKRQQGGRISDFQGLHLLHALARGVETIHHEGEYHGDLHDGNVIIRRYGISFDLKLLDMFRWGKARAENRLDDVCNLIRIFYDSIGGARFYSRHRPEVKAIILGLKRTLITRKFRSAGQLREYLETMEWG